MTDEELIARLRMRNEYRAPDFNTPVADTIKVAAADRIEALVKERDDCAIYLKDGETPRQRMDRDHADALSLMQLLSQEKSRAERLEAAVVEHNDLLRSTFQIAEREGVKGMIASTNWDAFYNRMVVVLQRHHQTANAARAAMKHTPE